MENLTSFFIYIKDVKMMELLLDFGETITESDIQAYVQKENNEMFELFIRKRPETKKRTKINKKS